MVKVNHLKEPKENGNGLALFFVGGIMVISLIILIVALVPNVINKYPTPRPLSSQIVLKYQGYDLSIDEVEDLLGEDYEFAIKGGRGPDTTVTLGDGEKIEVYLFVEVTGDRKFDVLKYQDDDSIVGNPRNIPRRPLNAW